jgi:hypothetical protein
MPIKNLSDVRRLPRLGKIALGVKKTTNKEGKPCSPFPTEVDYFVCPPAVQKVFGEKPKELRIMFPVNNDEVFFQQWNKCYGASSLKCKGDGERAWAWDDDTGGLKEIPCPCPKLEGGECKPIGTLQFLIPEVDGAGIWQITTSSKNSIIDVNSSIDFIRAVAGRIHMIPLILKREPRTMTRTEDNKQKKSTHYTLKLDIAEGFTLRQLQAAAQIKAECVLLPPADETKDDLLYPENGFAPDEPEKPVKLDKGHSSTLDDLPEGDDDTSTPDQTADIATLIEALEERGKSGKILAEIKKHRGIDLENTNGLTIEEADKVRAFLKEWVINIDEKRKQANA